MHKSERRPVEERVLVVAPTLRDARLCQSILREAGMRCTCCSDVAAVCQELQNEAGAALLTEEALSPDGIACLVEALGQQPPWSDLPVLVLTREGANSTSALRTLETLGNVTLLERPVRVSTMVSAVRTALRARRRQYEIRGYLKEKDRAAASLQEADRRKDDFLAQLAHELRGPLAPLFNALHILRLCGRDDAGWKQARDLADRQARQLGRLVDDLLDVSRIARGKVELRWERVDVSRVVANAVEAVRPLLEARHHQLTILQPPDPLRLEADPARLVQVLSNLLSNAVKYTDSGGRIWLTAERDGDEVLLRVRDTGIGLAPELLPHVFDLFFQADSGAQGGLGIGLNLVQGLVELHGGSIEVFSAGTGKGSEFVIRLPAIIDEKHRRPEDTLKVEAAPVRPRRVLVVDDDIDATQSLKMLLGLWGHDVRAAHDGQSALEVARSWKPEVVLLDISLPGGLNGYEVARRLRKEEGLQAVELLALTGWGQEEDRRKAEEAGFDLHLTKPIDPGQLELVLAGRAMGVDNDDRKALAANRGAPEPTTGQRPVGG